MAYTEEECVRADMARDDMKDAEVQRCPECGWREGHWRGCTRQPGGPAQDNEIDP